MNRRLFLNRGGRVALTAALLPAVACQSTTDKKMTAAAAETAGPPAASGAAEPFALHEATVADLQARLAKGTETARSLCEKYLARIQALNEHGPRERFPWSGAIFPGQRRGAVVSQPVRRILSWMVIHLDRRLPDGSCGLPGS